MEDPRVLEQLSQKAGAKPDQTKKLTQSAIPMLLSSLKENASTPEGAESLNRALEDHKNDNVGDIFGFLQNVDTGDGAKILQHIFSGKSEEVQQNLASSTGLEKNQASNLLTQLAPLILGALGNQKKEQGAQADVTGLLNSVIGSLGGTGQGSQSPASGLLGSILGSFFKKK
ncbi:MAG TPA: DUF937 domain-containing protein [Firmicutes bacterium]|nr:DUF937 domain-containing protein [Bacillota bacterium]